MTKLTSKEIHFLEMFDEDVFLTRDKCGRLFLTKDLPNLEPEEWNTDNPKVVFIELDKNMFSIVTWDSQKAWSNHELLEMEDMQLYIGESEQIRSKELDI